MPQVQMRIEYPAVKSSDSLTTGKNTMHTNKKLFEQLNKLRDSKMVIIGIGNTLKGDDGVGPLVCQQLAGKISAELMDVATVPENYIQPIIKKAPQNLLIIDAIDFGAPVGAIRIFKPEQLDSFVSSTHTLSPHLFIDMICKNIKVDVYFVGIQPAQIQLGQPMSCEVKQAARWLTRTLAKIFPATK